MSKEYKIGQVLYVISPKSQTIIPVQIQEINQKTTIHGEETIYLVQDAQEQGPFNLDEINGKLFINSIDAGKFLKENASKAIDAMIQQAVSTAQNKFGNAGGVDNIFPVPTKKSQKKQMSAPSMVSKSSEPIAEMDVEVVGKDGKSRIQKTKIRSVQMPSEVPAEMPAS